MFFLTTDKATRLNNWNTDSPAFHLKPQTIWQSLYAILRNAIDGSVGQTEAGQCTGQVHYSACKKNQQEIHLKHSFIILMPDVCNVSHLQRFPFQTTYENVFTKDISQNKTLYQTTKELFKKPTKFQSSTTKFRFYVIAVENIKIMIFWDMTSCSLVTNLKWLWRWNLHIPLKCWYPSAQLHSVIFQKTMSISSKFYLIIQKL